MGVGGVFRDSEGRRRRVVLDVHIRLDTEHPEQIWRWSGRLQRDGETLMTFDLSSDPAHLSQPPTSPRLERP